MPDVRIPMTAEGKYYLPAGTVLHYAADSDGGEKTLYFDCYDGMSTRFSEAFFGNVEIRVNGASIGLFPTAVNNGAICLGDINGYTDIELRIQKNITVGSFGVFAIDAEKLSSLISRAETAGLTEDGGGILSGSCTVSEPKTCLLSLPYNEGLRVRINGRKVPVRRVLSGLTAFDLEQGRNDITVSFVPSGLGAGLGLTALGAALTVLGAVLKKRGKRLSLRVCSGLWIAMTALSGTVFALIYVMPLIVNIFMRQTT